MAARAGMGGTAESLADQTAVLINTIGNSGVIVISSGNRANTSAIIAYRANASPFCNILCQPSTVFEVSTAILLGTTGTNGKVTFSATATAGQCYLENRLGASLSYIILRIS
jgi:UDP-N-acetylmuramoylalanine-D-glutamate ligase